MAKSARASRIKRNHTILRDTVHKPVEDARLERLNARLLDIAQNQKKESEKEKEEADAMETDAPTPAEGETPAEADVMETESVAATSSSKSKGKIVKRKNVRKAANSMVFKAVQKRKLIGKAKAKKANK